MDSNETYSDLEEMDISERNRSVGAKYDQVEEGYLPMFSNVSASIFAYTGQLFSPMEVCETKHSYERSYYLDSCFVYINGPIWNGATRTISNGPTRFDSHIEDLVYQILKV